VGEGLEAGRKPGEPAGSNRRVTKGDVAGLWNEGEVVGRLMGMLRVVMGIPMVFMGTCKFTWDLCYSLIIAGLYILFFSVLLHVIVSDTDSTKSVFFLPCSVANYFWQHQKYFVAKRYSSFLQITSVWQELSSVRSLYYLLDCSIYCAFHHSQLITFQVVVSKLVITILALLINIQ